MAHATKEYTDDDIDTVITWVSKDDPELLHKLHTARNDKRNISLKNFPDGHSNARYSDNGEIEYCIQGIRTFMPWIRNIYLVTDNQTPTFLSEERRRELNVSLVDHETIFEGYEWALPTFNSRSIETVLWRIPNLAERYIYLNDDFVPINPSEPKDFFIDGKTVTRGKWESYSHYGRITSTFIAIAMKILSKLSRKSRTAHLLAQMRAARMAGFNTKYFHSSHAPHAINTTTLSNYFKDNPRILQENIQHKFRHIDQFVTHPLAHHLEASKNNQVDHDGSDCLTINFQSPQNTERVLRHINDNRIKFICLQNMELCNPDDAHRIKESIRIKLSGELNHYTELKHHENL